MSLKNKAILIKHLIRESQIMVMGCIGAKFLESNLAICTKNLKTVHVLVSEITSLRKCEAWTRTMHKDDLHIFTF